MRKNILPYFVNQWEDSYHEIEDDLLKPLRGDFFCLPFGNLNKFNNEEHPNHGESATSLWTYDTSEKINSYDVHKFSLQTKVRDGNLCKKIGLMKNQNVVYLEHEVSGFKGPSSYGHHAILKVPEKENSVLVSTSPYKFGTTNRHSQPHSDKSDEYYFLESEKLFLSLEEVPSIWKDERTINCTTFPHHKGYGGSLAVYYDQRSPIAWTCAVYPEEGYLWFSLKDPSLFPGLLIWIENCGRKLPPWNGQTNCLGLVDMCGNLAEGLQSSVEDNWLNNFGIRTSLDFKGETKAFRYIEGVAPIPEGFKKVCSVEILKGEVIFNSETGQCVNANINTDFIFDGFRD